jgi:hypothetical protein
MTEDLKEEYSKYVALTAPIYPSDTEKSISCIDNLHRPGVKRGYFTIESIFRVIGSISQHFEPYMSPYV